MRRLTWPFTLTIAATLALPATAITAAPPTRVRLDGVGPLRLGMTRTAAVRTGWLTGRGKGCPLGGTPPVTYRFGGAKAPAALRGAAEFEGGRLTTLIFTRGARTATGVTVGSTTPARMVARYRSAGYTATSQYERVFQGTFVSVKRNGKQVIGGFAAGPHLTSLGLPTVPVCE